MKVAIVGGGITGLSAAYYLEKRTAQNAECEITLFERTSRLGGAISSPLEDGLRFEDGPDSFLSYKPAGLQLVEELGITDRLINSNVRDVYVVRKGRLVSFPADFHFFVPKGWGPLLGTHLFSWSTKLHAAGEILRHRRPSDQDLSVADFTRERFGDEIYQYLAEPLLSGIYGGDAEKLSMTAVLPQFLEYEKKYGNVVRGVVAAAQSTLKSKPRWAPFVSFRNGMQELTDALAARLTRTQVCLNSPVEKFPADFDAVILATPPVHSARLLRTAAPDVAEILDQIPCASTVTVSVIYRAQDLPPSEGGFGFLAPRVEHRKILGCSWLSAKYPARAREGHTYVRGFLGGNYSDDAAIDAVLGELRDLMGVKSTPEKIHVAHWPEVMAQPMVGHRERIAELQRRLQNYPRLALAGNFFNGIGIPDCIRTAREAAERIVIE